MASLITNVTGVEEMGRFEDEEEHQNTSSSS